MVRRLSVRAAPLTNRAVDYASVAPACCNVCRTCTTTNLVGLSFGVLAAAGAAVGRVSKRAARKR